MRRRSLTDTMNRLFWDDKNGGFYFTLADQKYLVVRTKNPYDSALPSGNAVAVNNLLTLAPLVAEKSYLDKAEKTLQNFRGYDGAVTPCFYAHAFCYQSLSFDGLDQSRCGRTKNGHLNLV